MAVGNPKGLQTSNRQNTETFSVVVVAVMLHRYIYLINLHQAHFFIFYVCHWGKGFKKYALSVICSFVVALFDFIRSIFFFHDLAKHFLKTTFDDTKMADGQNRVLCERFTGFHSSILPARFALFLLSPHFPYFFCGRNTKRN